MASSHADFHADQCSNGIRRLFIAVVSDPVPSRKHDESLLGILMLWTWFNYVHHCWEWLVGIVFPGILLCVVPLQMIPLLVPHCIPCSWLDFLQSLIAVQHDLRNPVPSLHHSHFQNLQSTGLNNCRQLLTISLLPTHDSQHVNIQN
jgi:hypothetical protein